METRLVVGLGNPGPQYEHTWHNLGFHAVRHLAAKLRCGFKQHPEALIGHTRYARMDVYLMQPLTYMNLSGSPVRELAKRASIDPDEILVIYDDHDLPLGQLRMREKGGDGGHRGLRSILHEVVSDQVSRLRVGIRDEMLDPEVGGYEDLAGRVLDELNDQERQHMQDMASAAADAARDWLVIGAKRAMNTHNRKRVPAPGEENTPRDSRAGEQTD